MDRRDRETISKRSTPLVQSVVRFFRRVEVTRECWIWRGATIRSRESLYYGSFGPTGRETTTAHRFSYSVFVGPIPDGYHVDHLCKNTLCVRPDHLEAVSPRENNARSNSRSARAAKQTMCAKGLHPLGPASPVSGKRRCRECFNAWHAANAYRYKNKPYRKNRNKAMASVN